METLDELVGGSRDVRKGNPGVLVRGQVLPMYQILETMADLAAIENRLNIKRGVSVIGKSERSGRRVRMKLGGISIRFKKRDVKNGMETREISGEAELVNDVRELALDGKRS